MERRNGFSSCKLKSLKPAARTPEDGLSVVQGRPYVKERIMSYERETAWSCELEAVSGRKM